MVLHCYIEATDLKYNSNLFFVARTSEENQVLGISADIRIIFPFRKHAFQQ